MYPLQPGLFAFAYFVLMNEAPPLVPFSQNKCISKSVKSSNFCLENNSKASQDKPGAV